MSDIGDAISRGLLAQVEDSLGARITALEVENQRLRKGNRIIVIGLMVSAGLIFASLVASASVLATRGGRSTVLEAREFTLKDEKGVTRGAWVIRDDGSTRLSLSDRNGVARLSFTILEGGSPGVVFGDSRGQPRIVLSLQPDESGSLVIADRDGQARAVLGLSGENDASLVFPDSEGITRAAFGVDTHGVGSLILANDTDGEAPVQMETEANEPSGN